MKTKHSIGLIAILVVTLAQVQMSAACSCNKTSVKASLEQATAVFAGKVVAVDQEKEETLIEISRYWKGVTTKTITLFPFRGLCNYYFRPGEEYLVYAYSWPQQEKKLGASICSPTKKLSEAAQDLEELGEGTPINK